MDKYEITKLYYRWFGKETEILDLYYLVKTKEDSEAWFAAIRLARRSSIYVRKLREMSLASYGD